MHTYAVVPRLDMPKDANLVGQGGGAQLRQHAIQRLCVVLRQKVLF